MSGNPIPLSSPDIGEDDIRAVTDVLKSGRLSLGPQLQAFEAAMAAYTGAKYAESPVACL